MHNDQKVNKVWKFIRKRNLRQKLNKTKKVKFLRFFVFFKMLVLVYWPIHKQKQVAQMARKNQKKKAGEVVRWCVLKFS